MLHVHVSCCLPVQYSRKSGSHIPTKWSDQEIELALEGEGGEGVEE